MAHIRNQAVSHRVESGSGKDIKVTTTELKELAVEVDRSNGRVFVVDGTNLMNYIKDGKVWITK